MMKKIIVILSIALLLTACGSKKVDLTDKSIPIKERVTSIVHNIVGEKVGKTDTVELIKYSNGILSVKINSDANAGSKQELLEKSSEIFADFSKMKEVKSATITWLAPMTDQYGKRSMGEILAIMIDGETFKKVNWNNYKSVDIEKIASGYKQDAGLEN